MTKSGFNLRKVATIIACLVVTTIFASCDQTNGDGNGERGRTLTADEQKLVGDWGMVNASGGVYDIKTGQYLFPQGYGIVYYFVKDGTFNQILFNNSSISKYAQFSKGLWSASNGTVSMTKREYQSSSDDGKTWTKWTPYPEPNATMKYRHGTDEKGAYFEDMDYEGGVKFYKW